MEKSKGWNGKGPVPDALAAHVQHEQRTVYGRELTLEQAPELAAERIASSSRTTKDGEPAGDRGGWRQRYDERKALEARRFRK